MAPANRKALTLWAWLRIAVKLAGLLLLLVGCVPLHYLWRITTGGSPWPRLFLSGVARIAGVKTRVEGQRVAKRTVLLANHVSWIDIPAIAGATGSAFVAHDGLARVALVRWLCSMNDTVFIARQNRAGIARQIAQIREAIDDCGVLTIFPEGTTSDGAELLPFKSALLSALDQISHNLEIRPVWLDYGPDRAEIAWVGEEAGVDNFLRILARPRPITLTVHLLPPLSGNALANRKTMTTAAHQAILDKMETAGTRHPERDSG